MYDLSDLHTTQQPLLVKVAKFYLVAIFFIVFDVEISLLFPWALSLYQVGWCGFFSAGLLLVSLAVGFVYELCSGALEWE